MKDGIVKHFIEDIVLIQLLTIRYAAEVGAVHYHCSAKLNTGVKEMFSDLTRSMF
jgi:hypothetical protein